MIITSYDLAVLFSMIMVFVGVFVFGAVINLLAKQKQTEEKMREVMQDFDWQQHKKNTLNNILPTPVPSSPFRTLGEVRKDLEPLPLYNPPVVNIPTRKVETRRKTVRHVDGVRETVWHKTTTMPRTPSYRYETDVNSNLEDVMDLVFAANQMESMMRFEQAEKTYEMMDKSIAEPSSNIVESVVDSVSCVAETTYESASSAYDSVSESVSDTYNSVSDSVSDFFSSDD